MTEQTKVLEAIKGIKANLLLFSLSVSKYDVWEKEVKEGKVEDEGFREWIRNQIAYYGEKDRPFATYLEGLLK